MVRVGNLFPAPHVIIPTYLSQVRTGVILCGMHFVGERNGEEFAFLTWQGIELIKGSVSCFKSI